MWGTLAVLGLDVGVWAINKYLGHAEPIPKPPGFDIANTQEGVPVPMLYGTNRIDAPLLAWHGNQTIVSGDSFGVPYLYGVDLLFVLGVPMYGSQNALCRVWWGDVLADSPFNGHGHSDLSLLDGQMSVFKVNGGADSVGAQGRIQFFGGSPTQDVFDPSTLAYAMLATSGYDMTLAPGFRNQVVVAMSFSGNTKFQSGIFTGTQEFFHCGAAPALPQISFEVQCIS